MMGMMVTTRSGNAVCFVRNVVVFGGGQLFQIDPHLYGETSHPSQRRVIDRAYHVIDATVIEIQSSIDWTAHHLVIKSHVWKQRAMIAVGG